MKMRWNLSLVRMIFLLLVFALCHTPIMSAENIPAELTGFETTPWQVESYRYGDLSGRKTKDAAIILAIYPKGVLGIATDRKLIITMRKTDAKLERENKASQALRLGGDRSGGNPTVEIQKNTILITQLSGSSDKGKQTYQYKKINGEWRLISFSSSCWDSMVNARPSANTNVNFLNGQVQAWSEREGRTIEKQNFYEIQSFRAKTSIIQRWTVPKIIVHSKTSSKNPADADGRKENITASIQSKYDKKDLYILVTISGVNNKVHPDIELLNLAQMPIHPSSITRSSRVDKYQELLRFSFADRDFNRGLGKISHATTNSHFFPFTLVIYEKKTPNAPLISTAISAEGGKKHGGLLLLPMAQPPSLSTVDFRDGSIHPNVIPLPLYY